MHEELRKLQEEVEDLKRQQRVIEERLETVSRGLEQFDSRQLHEEPAAPEPGGAEATAGRAVPPAEAVSPPPPRAESTAPARSDSHDLESKIGGIWLNRIGVIVFILGAAFFLMYAFEQGWINELTRVIIGAITGLALMAFGERSRRRGYHGYAQGLTGGGIALLYFTIFAAFYYYDILTPSAGLALMIVVTTGAVVLSVYQNAPAIAALGLLTAFLNPLLFVVREPEFFYLLLYLLLINLGINAIVYLRRWTFMGVSAFFTTHVFLLVVLIYRLGYPEAVPGPVTYQVFLTLFLLLFLALPLLLDAVHRRPVKPLGVVLFVLAAAFYYGLSWLNLYLRYLDDMSLFTLALAGFFLLAGLGLQRLLPFRDQSISITTFGVTAALLFLFVPLQFAQPWVTIGWTLQAAALCFLGLHLADRRIHIGFWIVLTAAFLHLYSYEWFAYVEPRNYVFLWNRPAALTLFFIAALAACAWLYHRYTPAIKGSTVSEIRLLGGAAGLIFLIYGSAEIMRYGGVMAALTDNWSYFHNMRMLFLSLFWTVYAVVLALAGFIGKYPLLRFAAIALFGLTVLKVFLIDLSFMELVYRIITLVGLGLIMLAVSYLYQRYRSRIDSGNG